MELWTLKRYRCLVVDDFPEMRSMLRGMLEAYGAKDVGQAKNGDEAIEILASRRFDIILCDYNLGDGKDGQQVLEEARHRGLLPHSTLFLMVTAETTPEMVMGALEYEPDEYLSKPVTKTVLQRRLRRLLARMERLRPISDALREKDLEGALARCDEQLAGGSGNRFELLRLKCELLLETGRYRDVEAVCEEVLSEREIPWASLLLGRAYYHLGEYREAKFAFEEIIEQAASFVSAYDWLAKTLERLGHTREAQRALLAAVKISPKSLLRQRALAVVAAGNGDQEVSERARRQALRVGAHSVLKEPNDYAALARILVAKGDGDEAMRVVDSMRAEFSGGPGAEISVALTEYHVYGALGRDEEAGAALEAAVKLYEAAPEQVPREATLELAAACLDRGDGKTGDEILERVVRNHHDDEPVLDPIRRLYADAGRENEGAAIILAARQEVVSINDRGVRLAEEGKIEESIELLTRAVDGMPRNHVINLSAAQSLVLSMRERGVRRKRLARALACLAVARDHDASNPRCRRLLAECRRLAEERRSA